VSASRGDVSASLIGFVPADQMIRREHALLDTPCAVYHRVATRLSHHERAVPHDSRDPNGSPEICHLRRLTGDPLGSRLVVGAAD
jgi:hypothetical protein